MDGNMWRGTMQGCHVVATLELSLKKQDRGTPPLYRNKYSISLK